MPSPVILGAKMRRFLWSTLALLLTSRLLSMALLPLADATESRYGEIARKMLETANWITPQYSYGVPFWGKPPLSTWLSALSMGLLGVNEFAVRLPALLLGLGVLSLIWRMGIWRHNRDFSLLSVTVLAALPLFFIVSGTVMTDASLVFSVTLSFTAFWRAMEAEDHRWRRLWGYLFFAGQGLGLLAKGPICGVLSLPPVLLWILTTGNQWRLVWQRLPWISGCLLMLGLAAPWYLWAEVRTPGFLDYFLVGEHLKRFLVPGWSGDKYGHAHEVPLGMVWGYWGLAALPWSLIALTWAARRLRSLGQLFRDQDGWSRYLLWWTLWPLAFFSLAHNIIWTYALTALPPFALLVVEMWHRGREARGQALPEPTLRLWSICLLPALLAMLASLILLFPPAKVMDTSQKFLVRKYQALRPSAESPLLFLFVRRYSAEFYTGGQVRYLDRLEDLAQFPAISAPKYLALKARDIPRVPEALLRPYRQVAAFGTMVLFEEGAMVPEIKGTNPGTIH